MIGRRVHTPSTKLRIIFATLVASVLLVPLLGFILPSKVTATGEQLNWAVDSSDNDTPTGEITATGGLFTKQHSASKSYPVDFRYVLPVSLGDIPPGITFGWTNGAARTGTLGVILGIGGNWQPGQNMRGLACVFIFSLELTSPSSARITDVTSNASLARWVNGSITNTVHDADAETDCADVAKEDYPLAGFSQSIAITGTAPEGAYHDNHRVASSTYTWDGDDIVGSGDLLSSGSSRVRFTRQDAKTFNGTDQLTCSTNLEDPQAPKQLTTVHYTITFSQNIGTGAAGLGTISTTDCGLNIHAIMSIAASAGTTITDASCGSGAEGLGWLMCPLITMLAIVIQTVEGWIIDALIIETDSLFDRSRSSGQAFYKAWSVFRDIAFVVIVLMGLVMVVSQILGMDAFDAYTIRKMLPRLIVSVILITLSWNLTEIVFNITTDAAYAVQDLIKAPFSGVSAGIGLGNDDFIFSYLIGIIIGPTGAIAGVAYLIILGPAGTLALVASAAIAVLLFFVALAGRNTILELLIMVIPIPLAVYPFKMLEGFANTVFRIGRDALLAVIVAAAIMQASREAALVAMASDEEWAAAVALGCVIAGIVYAIKMFFSIDPTARQVQNGLQSVFGGIQKGLANYQNKRFKEGFEKAAATGVSMTGGKAANLIARGIHEVASIRNARGLGDIFTRSGRKLRRERDDATVLAQQLEGLQKDPLTQAASKSDVATQAARDAAIAGKWGDKDEIRRKILAADTAKDPKERKFTDAQGNVLATRRASLDQAVDQALSLHSQVSHDKNGALALTALHGTTGSLNGENVGAAAAAIADIAGDNTALRDTAIGVVKGALTGAGRGEAAVRQGGWITAIENVKQYTADEEERARREGRAMEPGEARRRAIERVADDMARLSKEQNGWQILAQSRPETSEAFGRVIQREALAVNEELTVAQAHLEAVQRGQPVMIEAEYDNKGNVIRQGRPMTEEEAKRMVAQASDKFERYVADLSKYGYVAPYLSDEKSGFTARGAGMRLAMYPEEDRRKLGAVLDREEAVADAAVATLPAGSSPDVVTAVRKTAIARLRATDPDHAKALAEAQERFQRTGPAFEGIKTELEGRARAKYEEVRRRQEDERRKYESRYALERQAWLGTLSEGLRRDVERLDAVNKELTRVVNGEIAEVTITDAATGATRVVKATDAQAAIADIDAKRRALLAREGVAAREPVYNPPPVTQPPEEILDHDISVVDIPRIVETGDLRSTAGATTDTIQGPNRPYADPRVYSLRQFGSPPSQPDALMERDLAEKAGVLKRPD